MPILIRCTLKCGYCAKVTGAIMPLIDEPSAWLPLLEGEWTFGKSASTEVYCSVVCSDKAEQILEKALGENIIDDGNGGKVKIHSIIECAGKYCTFHRPSNHHMKLWPMIVRESTLVERRCPHGIGHPDPDSLAYFERKEIDGMGVHGCDGCCKAKK